MKWLVRSHKEAQIKTNRRAPTLDEAIELAKRLTKTACEKSREDLLLHHGRVPEPIVEKPKTEPESFSTTHFTCICANPTAQVWQCVSQPGEKKHAGRPPRKGAAPKQATFKHTKGDCAVLMGSTPVREEDGSIRVFKSWIEAEEYAYDLYLIAYEEGDAITWHEGDTVVDRLTNVDIIFDPAVNGKHRPFSLWFPRYSKPYYAPPKVRSYVTTAKQADGSTLDLTSLDKEGQAAHALNRKLERMAAEEDRNHNLTMEVATFRTIWEAEKQATRLERDYFHNPDYMV